MAYVWSLGIHVWEYMLSRKPWSSFRTTDTYMTIPFVMKCLVDAVLRSTSESFCRKCSFMDNHVLVPHFRYRNEEIDYPLVVYVVYPVAGFP